MDIALAVLEQGWLGLLWGFCRISLGYLYIMKNRFRYTWLPQNGDPIGGHIGYIKLVFSLHFLIFFFKHHVEVAFFCAMYVLGAVVDCWVNL